MAAFTKPRHRASIRPNLRESYVTQAYCNARPAVKEHATAARNVPQELFEFGICVEFAHSNRDILEAVRGVV